MSAVAIPASAPPSPLPSPTSPRAIESDSFPFEYLSAAAAVESWRKEINRPIYHMHKWWAQRLGTVFRGLILGGALPADESVEQAFASPARLPGTVVFDPFMGSGTTVGEALKLGARAVGRDINPVCVRTVRAALQPVDQREVTRIFTALAERVEEPLRDLYRVNIDGQPAEVLYHFWVMTVACPGCCESVDLFSSQIFARHAYPSRVPLAQAVCPRCGEVQPCRADATDIACSGCEKPFPAAGAVRGARADCPSCRTTFRIVDAVDAQGCPPSHRLYAKLVLLADGSKRYCRADDADIAAYQSVSRRLQDRVDAYPIAAIEDGYNTRQVLRYGITHWHQFFNARQLFALSVLADGIQALLPGPGRDLMVLLFSGALEFNNMFASYKGEGTGAVRHMFSHHVLKPERMPIEANLWGTPKSSGSFSGLFKTRILRGLAYAAEPFELVPTANGSGAERVSGLSESVGTVPADSWQDFDRDARSLYVCCGPSQRTDLPNASVDLVVTDPPFFDNVHYSELADFFHVWQEHLDGKSPSTTRASSEVQHGTAETFAERLGDVFREASRVLKDDGLLVFTYHHSRSEGWAALLSALHRGRFVVTATHPVKSEMAVAAPKAQSKAPIDIDLIVVCRKSTTIESDPPTLRQLEDRALAQVERMRRAGHPMGVGDVRVAVLGGLLPLLTRLDGEEASRLLERCYASDLPSVA